MAESKQKWVSRTGRRVMLARLRCRLGRHNWHRTRNAESGDAYDQCHYCGQLKHVDVIGKSADQVRGVTSFNQGGGFGGFGGF
jgi:hypothetical protein